MKDIIICNKIHGVRIKRSAIIAKKSNGWSTTNRWWLAIENIETTDKVCIACIIIERLISNYPNELDKKDLLRFERSIKMLKKGFVPKWMRYYQTKYWKLINP